MSFSYHLYYMYCHLFEIGIIFLAIEAMIFMYQNFHDWRIIIIEHMWDDNV